MTFTIVSRDADFAEMAALLQSPPKRAELIAALETGDAVCLEVY